MFFRLARFPLRRCLHTVPPRPSLPHNARLRFTVGASTVVAGACLIWHLASDGHRIALDTITTPPTNSSSNNSSISQDLPARLGTGNSLASDPLSFQPEAEGSPENVNADASGDKATKTPSPDVEQDASSDTGSGGAFNPVTGEINWDCPCLGGMAHGPCGPQFREAFSCFVFSEEEPKGINCVEKFKAMQTCFREHPEIYGDEIMDDDEDEGPMPVPTPTEGAVMPSSVTDVPEEPVDSVSTDIPKSQTLQAQKNRHSASAPH